MQSMNELIHISAYLTGNGIEAKDVTVEKTTVVKDVVSEKG